MYDSSQSNRLTANVTLTFKTKKSVYNIGFTRFNIFGGERGIRTPGPVTVNGFQDRRDRPLCHSSGAKIRNFTACKKTLRKMPS